MSELEDVPVWHNSRRKPGPTGASRELFGSDVLARGNACYAVGDYVGAAQLYSDALLQAAGDPAACCALLLNRSAAHAGLQQWQASLADANKAEAAGGNSARAHYRRGMALVQLGRPDEAAAAFRAGLASSPGSARLAAALAAAEAAARAGFQQRRAAAGAAAQDTRRASAELQAQREAGTGAAMRHEAAARQAAVARGADASDPAHALRRTTGSNSNSQGAGSTSGLPESAWQAASNGTSSSTAATAAQAAMAAAGAGSHYETLGVAPSAGGGEIRRAYWRQATLTHPDKGGSDDAFAQVRTAYEVLSDPLLRSLYDTKLSSHHGGHGGGGREASGASNVPAASSGSPMDSGTDEPMEAEDAFAQRQREAAVVAHKDGRSAFWTGDFRAAVEHFTEAIRAFRSAQSAPDPDCDAASAIAQTFLERCRAHMSLSQALQAEADAEEALATLPASLAPAGHMWLGRARLAQGNWADAAAAFRATLCIIGGPQDSSTAGVAAQARAGLAQAENGAAALAALFQSAPRMHSLLRMAASNALFRPSNQPAGGPVAPGGRGKGFQEGHKLFTPYMPGVAEDHAMPPAPVVGWRGLGTRTSREDPGEGSSGGPRPSEAARRSPLAPADALQAARALLSSRDSSFDTADGDCIDPKRRRSAETAPRGGRAVGGRRVRSFDM